MPNTPNNINVPPRTFVDLYAQSGIAPGSPIQVVLITDKPGRVTFGAMPVGEYGYQPLQAVGDKASGSSTDGAWFWSEFGGVINVSDFFSEPGSERSGTKSVSGRMLSQLVNLTGTVDETIVTGAFDYFRIDGVEEDPQFLLGVWVVPEGAGGVYQFNAHGAVDGEVSPGDFVELLISKNDATLLADPDSVISSICFDNDDVGLGGQLLLNAGDNVRVKYSIMGGSNWGIANFVWDFSRVGD